MCQMISYVESHEITYSWLSKPYYSYTLEERVLGLTGSIAVWVQAVLKTALLIGMANIHCTAEVDL